MELERSETSQTQHDTWRFINARSGIESDKNAERKKSATDLKDLLQQSHVLDYIDSGGKGGEGSSRSRGKGRGTNGHGDITWLALFRSILVFFDKEADSISKLEDKGSTSAAAHSNRQMRKKDIAELVKVYVRAANKKGRLPVSEVLSHMLHVLDSKTMCAWVGVEYSHILHNYILTVPECVVQILGQKLDELFNLFCRLYLSSSSTTNKALNAKILYVAISHFSAQTDLPVYKLYCFFSRAFSSLTNEEKNSKVLEYLLSAFNAFSTSPAVYNARGRLSRLGEEMLPSILSLWSRATQHVREQMVTFLRTQVRVHHPLGRHTDETGAWVHDERTFKKNLERLYDMLIEDFESSTARLRWAGKCEGSQLVDMLSLSVDVIYQVMYLREGHGISVTSDLTQHQDKRQKLQTCWGTLREGLSMVGSVDTGCLVSWLQLVSWLLSRWPDSLSTEDYIPLLTALSKLLRETQKSDCVGWVMVCLSTLAMNPVSKTAARPPSLAVGLAPEIWKKVWLSTMKILSVRTAEPEGYNLLTQLLELGLVSCDMEPWKLFNATFNLPTRPVTSFIASILQNHTLPDRPLPHVTTPFAMPTILATQQSMSDHSHCLTSYPLRSQLLRFLLPLSLSVDAGMETQGADSARRVSHWKMRMANSTSPALLAHLLVALTQRSCSSAKLSLLKPLYMPASSPSYVRGLLEATDESLTHSTTTPDSESLLCDNFEQIYLESTFDMSVNVPYLNKVDREPLTLSRENTISMLLSFLLDQSSKRSEMLLQPIDFLSFAHPREYCQYLSVLLETQAHHCSVVLHTALLLSHCDLWDSVKSSPPFTTISTIVKEMVTTLKNWHWNDVEKQLYYETARAVLHTLRHLVNFPHLESHLLSPSVAEAVRVARELSVTVIPKELMELVKSLTQGKFPALSPPSVTSNSAFSVFGSSSRSNSRLPSETAASQQSSPMSDDDLELSDGSGSSLGDSYGGQMHSPGGILSSSVLSPRAQCQIEAARFLCLGYLNYAAVEVGSVFDYQSALLSMLTEGHDLKKPVHIQMIFEAVQVLTSGVKPLEPAVLDPFMDVFGVLLKVHLKNQSVYHKALESLTLLASHLCRCEPDERSDLARESYQTLVSAFWGLYIEGSLPSRVRLKLAQLLQTLFLQGKCSSWTNLIVKSKKKKGEGPAEVQEIGVREALIKMVEDSDHCVRMSMAKIVSSLYLDTKQGSPLPDSCDSHVLLLPMKEQESIFERVTETLHKADMVERGQDELSIEDESVNRVSSMIATLQYQACVSSVCEKKIVSILITAVGKEQIDADLAKKAFNKMAVYLGYHDTRQLMEGMLVTLVSCWMEAGLPLDEFPIRLMGCSTIKEFLSEYSAQIIPFLVHKCDEETLESLSSLLRTPLPSLLKDSLPATMVLIVTTHAQQDKQDSQAESQERRKKASEAHNLVLRHLSEEDIAQTILGSIDEFVVQLFIRMFEPHESCSQLSKYTLTSDPEPCAPHFTSLAVRATLDYMPSCYGNTAPGTSFVKLLSRRKDNIQRILLLLAMRILTTHRSFEKRRYLLAYHLFVKLVCRELEIDLENTRSFIIMDIVHTVVRILSQEDSDGLVKKLFPLCCDTLEMVCKTSLESCPEELTRHLHSVVAVLTTFAQTDKCQEKAMSLLMYLLDSVAPQDLVHLDPFPDGSSFPTLSNKLEELRQEMVEATLADEIDRFLAVGQQCPQAVRTEALRFLQKRLHSSKLELASLVRQGSNNPVLQLIQGLISHGQVTPAVSCCEVTRCLGEVGPTDLGCIAIPAHSRERGSLATSDVTEKILHHLGTLLQDRDISVVQASGECLRGILATRKGQEALSSLEDDRKDCCLYLEPFRQQRKKKAAKSLQAVSRPLSFTSLADLADLWIPSEGVSHRVWLTQLVTTLINSEAVTDEVLQLLEPVCRVKVELCEEIFPFLIHDILSSNIEDHRRILSHEIQLFFSTVTSTHPSRPPTPSPSTQALPSHAAPPVSPDSVRTMLNMIMYLRTVDKPKQTRGPNVVSTPWDNNFWLDLNFLDVAMAAQQCSAYFTSLLYIEIWHGANSSFVSRRHRSVSSSSSVSDEMELSVDSSSKSAQEVKVQRLLLEAYSRIGEPDGLYGACSAHATDEATRVRLYEHEGQWHKALSSYSLQLQVPGSTCESSVAESLHQLGLTPVLNMYLRGVESVWGEGVTSVEVGEYQYEAAWRMTTWDDQAERHPPFNPTNESGGYHQCVYNCITALRDGEPTLLSVSLSEARSHVMRPLLSGGLESTYSLFPSLSKLLSLLELEEASQNTLTPPGLSQDTGLTFIEDWDSRLPHLDCDFQFVEPVLALRHSTLHCLLVAAGREVKGQSDVLTRKRVEGLFGAIRDNLLTQAQLAREAGRYQVAEGALFNLKQLQAHRSSYTIPESLCPSLSWRIQLEEAKIEWERGEGPLAMALLKSLLLKFGEQSSLPPDVASLYPLALSLYGSWLADTQSESPSVIMSRYLERSVTLMSELKGSSGQPEVVKAYLTLARFSDTQYQRIKRHMESLSFQNKKQLLDRSKQELQKLQTMSGDARHVANRHVRALQAHSKEDEIVVDNLLGEKQDFLEKALLNYILCLKAGDEHDLRVFRLVALWFANSTHPKVNKIIQSGVKALETRKFLPLMYQLAARMSARSLDSDPFQQALQYIIYQTAVDHPHHCLYSILALSNASKDDKFPSSGHVTGTKYSTRSGGRLSRKGGTSGSVDEDKVKAASALITKLRKQNPTLVQSAEQLCDAYMDLAYHDAIAMKRERDPIPLPTSCPLLKLTKKGAAVPTIDLEVDQSCDYSDVVRVDGFDPFFELAGGVNLPKVISCVGSDGKRRRQLVKGKDDLRQDAVMQQVFVLVNRLLKKDPTTSKRRLCVRTYKVIPLSQRSGIVEWCEETCPLGEYLIGPPRNSQSGAHYRYQPNDWPSIECRKKLMNSGSDRKSKFKVYSEICHHFHPVFHHFFMEKFPSPPQWFERRLSYTRSVAASSIVGYLLGLGDRHVQNILIDKNTAEFIHIDLGVAFEQGKTLPTPETVPFRLTRDMVDGMGIAGVEGVFRRCCEKTTVLMRAHQEELRTIVEVLLHDPLYQWTLSPLKALNLQRAETYDDAPPTPSTNTSMDLNGAMPSSGTNSSNKMAERVLLRLQEKLGGIEEGVPLSVNGQVNRLIQEATDPANLCVLFPGWQPWI